LPSTPEPVNERGAGTFAESERTSAPGTSPAAIRPRRTPGRPVLRARSARA